MPKSPGLVQAITLNTDWIDQVLVLINVEDEVEKVRERRQQLEERLRRLGKAYVDGFYAEADYHRGKRYIGMGMGSLVVPGADAVERARRLIERLPALWFEANMEERRKKYNLAVRETLGQGASYP